MRNSFGVFGLLVCLLFVPYTLGTEATTPVATVTPEGIETCQCGVFLLGLEPLVFSPNAKPILSGMPVPANCSAGDDKLQCSSICRQLIETMSQSNENSPLVQTVVLAATRTLACQRFNESERVPLPRTIDGTTHHARLDGETNKWKFLTGASARSDLGSETESPNNAEENDTEYDSENAILTRLTKPKYLGGFYRWCDEHWIYAGVSLHEPLCCLQHLPKKCPTSLTARNGRRPRLIIRRCPNDDCSSEEEYQNLEISAETTSSTSKAPPTSETLTADSQETESPDPETFDNYGNSSETDTLLHPFDSTPSPVKNRRPFNSTVVAEAFKFVSSLMDSLGYGDVVNGITSVLPQNTAAELLERVDVGGWVTNYQDRYMSWPREFSMGYCYVEYSLYNVASDGIAATTSNLLSRVFKPSMPTNNIGTGPSRSSLMPQHPHGPPPPEIMNGVPQPQPLPYNNNPSLMNNYIPQIPDNNFAGYGQGHQHRRVKRSPGVTVSRSYSTTTGDAGVRAVRRKVVPRARNAAPASEIKIVENTHQEMYPGRVDPAPQPAHANVYGHEAVQTSFVPSSSFIPTGQTESRFLGEPHNQHMPVDTSYNDFLDRSVQVDNTQPQKSTQGNNLLEYARPRRNPPYQPHPQSYQQQPPPQQAASKSTAQKEGPSAGSLMNLANMLMQTAMAGNGQSDGDKVSSIMQNALPLVSQVATNPAIQNMVSSIVTSFLTPPQANKPPPPVTTPPPPTFDDEDEELYDSSEDRYPPVKTGGKNPAKKPIDPFESNEINEPEVQSSNNKPSSSSPTSDDESGGSPGGGPDGSFLASMFTKMIKAYVSSLFQPAVNREPASNSNKPPSSRPSRPGESSKPVVTEDVEKDKDVVGMISDVAKPFFISYFGVVPGEPGFGKLRISNRRDRYRLDISKEGQNFKPSDILQNDPDAGTGITDIVFGSVNIPETGNGVYDFGNRVVYAFSRANDPQQGMYCFKQYVVNKLWDYFRVGVRAVFKK